MDVTVRVLVAQKYTGFGKDIFRPGQAIYRAVGDRFTCPEEYALGLEEKEFVKILSYEEQEEAEIKLPHISEAARKFAENFNLDWKVLEGTGRGGQITVKDVRVAVEATGVTDDDK